MKKKIYLIHHSHTDIGYTHPQEIIKIYHQDFIDQAIDLVTSSKDGKFRWTCENYWQIENYLKAASSSDVEQLIELMKNDKIDFSLNYLNMTELIDLSIYEEKLIKAKQFSDQNNLGFNTAMSADINGYSKLYVEKLAKNGITNNISCVHTHHGAHAFGKKPYIFNWKTKHGNVRTVLAPHYHLGNELFMMPNAGTTYLLDDNGYGIDTENINLEITRERVLKYFEDVQNIEGYHYDYIPVMVSGVISDNGMPNDEICTVIELWNRTYDDIELELVTLNQFFKQLDRIGDIYPIHEGDMNDWWADGVGSTPKGTKIFKSAQRKYNLMKALNPKYVNDQVVSDLIMYAEHTWGHSASISNPYNTLVDEMMLKKQNYAINAHSSINADIENFLVANDKVTILPNREKKFRIVNTLNTETVTTGVITLEHWEMVDGVAVQNCSEQLEVIDSDGNRYLTQIRPSDRGHEVEFEINLEAHEERLLKVVRNSSNVVTIKNEVCDKTNDFANKRFERHISNVYNTKHYQLKIDCNQNQISIYDKETNKNVSDSNDFLKLITTSTNPKDQCGTRRAMGRNRISGMSTREVASKINFEFLEIGPVYSVIRIHQQHSKMLEAYIDLKLYNNIKRIGLELNYLKHASKDIENIYLNFNLNETKSLTLSKGGDTFDPASDLLPEANNQFFISGESITTQNYQLLIADSALVTFDNGIYQEINLNKRVNKNDLSIWLANNFWETNFYTDLSGYHSFRFVLEAKGRDIVEQHSFENPLVYPTKSQFKEKNV